MRKSKVLHVHEVEASPHTAPASREQALRTVEPIGRVLHLADLTDGQQTLCGLPRSKVATGGYCEHLDGNAESPSFVRMIFSYDGQPGESCPDCLKKQPVVL